MPEAAVMLGLKEEVAYHLVRRKLLPSKTRSEGKREVSDVTEDDIALFQTTYMSLAQLASERGVSVRKQMKDLEELRIEPVTGSNVDGCRKFFYRRSDVLAQLQAREASLSGDAERGLRPECRFSVLSPNQRGAGLIA